MKYEKLLDLVLDIMVASLFALAIIGFIWWLSDTIR
jgi:hypothetical protein